MNDAQDTNRVPCVRTITDASRCSTHGLSYFSRDGEHCDAAPRETKATEADTKPKRPLYPGDVALYHDLCVTYVSSEKRQDEHWLAKFALERYDQIMPLLLAALAEDGRAEAQQYIDKRPF